MFIKDYINVKIGLLLFLQNCHLGNFHSLRQKITDSCYLLTQMNSVKWFPMASILRKDDTYILLDVSITFILFPYSDSTSIALLLSYFGR